MIPEPDGAGDCQRLLVYGTLRRGLRLHHHLERLGALFLSEAEVAAELFDLGSYPGARPVIGKGKWVCGELFQLRRTFHDLKVLDQVEGFIPEAPDRSEFVRALTPVFLPNGSCKEAWIYWLSAPSRAGHRRIASGDYAEWQARNGTV
jgi:gamma-glutamylcyclotransferase (GGCT)/AIG2-like uncharacterized protein YtfP